MKSNRLFALLFGLSLAAGRTGWSAPVDLSAPGNELGAANSKGYLEIWREVDGVGLQLGKDSYLPLRYRFSTESDKAGLLGAGFYLPMFEARNILLRENTMRAYLPCGKGLYLWRTADDPSKFQTPDKIWTGYATEYNFTISRDDGWKVIYWKGRLASITSDDGRKFIWSYDGAGGGTVEQDGKPLIAMEAGPAGQIADFVFAGKSYKVEYGKRPIIETVAGQNVLKELVPALTTLTFPDGKAQTFVFGLSDERLPRLTAADKTSEGTDYIWDASSRHIGSEKNARGEWTYKVGEITGKFILPTLSRMDSQGKVESSHIDDKSGTYTKQSKDGSVIITHVFKTPGPLYGKVRSVESEHNGTKSILYKADYDDGGKIIRSTDATGFITNFKYAAQGKRTVERIIPPVDHASLGVLQQEEQVLIDLGENAKSEFGKNVSLRRLAEFYIFKVKNPTKALSLLAKIDHVIAYVPKVQCITFNDVLTSQDKISAYKQLLIEYPERETNLQFLIDAEIADQTINK